MYEHTIIGTLVLGILRTPSVLFFLLLLSVFVVAVFDGVMYYVSLRWGGGVLGGVESRSS